MTTYEIRTAPAGHAIVMKDDEGFEQCIEVGIKSYEQAVKRCNRWIKRENQARAKLAKEAR